MAWNEYRSHKIVKAAQITGVCPKADGETTPVLLVDGEEFSPNIAQMAEKASVGDYAVIYEDGYRSVSPKAAFEGGYTAITQV